MSRLVPALVLSAVAATLASGASADTKLGVPGFMNFATGKFTPKATSAPAGSATAVSGTIILKISAAIDGSIGASVPIYCRVDMSADDPTPFSNEIQVYGVAATRSGSSATCDITIPYLWTVSSLNENVSIFYEIYSDPNVSSNVFTHSFSNSLTIPLPKSGSTTTIGQGPTI